MHAKGRGETHDVLQTDVPFAAFHTAHISSVDPSLGSERLLTQSRSFAQNTHTPAESPLGVILHSWDNLGR